jgi:hypothetical protein
MWDRSTSGRLTFNVDLLGETAELRKKISVLSYCT